MLSFLMLSFDVIIWCYHSVFLFISCYHLILSFLTVCKCYHFCVIIFCYHFLPFFFFLKTWHTQIWGKFDFLFYQCISLHVPCSSMLPPYHPSPLPHYSLEKRIKKVVYKYFDLHEVSSRCLRMYSRVNQAMHTASMRPRASLSWWDKAEANKNCRKD